MAPGPVGLVVFMVGILLFLYTYFFYPLILWALGFLRERPSPADGEPTEWPRVSISVPAHNEEEQIGGLIQSLLALDYPRDRVQILIVSDASTDRTDEIVRSFADEGVEFLRMPERAGKTKAEDLATEHLRGDIIVNTDASIRIPPHSLKPLIAALSDPAVGLASGRDVSVGPNQEYRNTGESGYVGYEMAIRDLETRVYGIVGASGCFYAIRAQLHQIPLPGQLSRDFAAALHTREYGFRSVSVPEAICFVPRTASLRDEYHRKVRTITRGIGTLFYKKALLNPLNYGAFSWMLFSHKVCRWALPWFAVAAFLSLALPARSNLFALGVLVTGLSFIGLALGGWALSERSNPPRVLMIPAYIFFGNLAAMNALVRHLRGARQPIWEPTRRTGSEAV